MTTGERWAESLRTKLNAAFRLELRSYEGSRPTASLPLSAWGSADASEEPIAFAGATWRTRVEVLPVPGEEATDVRVAVRAEAGSAGQVAVAAGFELSGWTRDAYVLIPGAVYNGNRYRSREAGYPPIFELPEDLSPDIPVTITDVPRLNDGAGPSRLEQTSEDAATPGIGAYLPELGQGLWLLTGQQTEAGPIGLTVEEDESRSQGRIMLSLPSMREDGRKGDRAPDWGPGDEAELRFRVYAFPCAEPQGLFNRLADIRKAVVGSPEEAGRAGDLPMSAACDILERKFNRDNWEPGRGYYAVGVRDNRYQDWQPGWVGGGMSTLPLSMLGSALSRERARSTLDYLFSRQAPSGLFHGVEHEGVSYGDGFHRVDSPRWHLVRKSADALYFAMKQIELAERQDGREAPAHWLAGARAAADAFVRLWRTYGQFGQFADVDTGELLVGGSTGPAIASAGLALAAVRFREPAYLRIAEEAAVRYDEGDARRCVTTGGPGEILQCPDSESAFGLLESFVALYEATGGSGWAERAARLAKQCMSWVVSYDYRWPPGSEFGRLGIRSKGSVIANVQNKHSAPGICTLSGDALLKLYRATGDESFLELLEDIARGLPQYLSRADRPVRSWDPGKPELPEGWMCERVNLSDWEGRDKIGEVFRGTCWCETSLMLTIAEVPGLYVQPDTGVYRVFDALEAEVLAHDAESGALTLQLRNPTAYAARTTVLAETSSRAGTQPLGPLPLWGCGTIALAPGETTVMTWQA